MTTVLSELQCLCVSYQVLYVVTMSNAWAASWCSSSTQPLPCVVTLQLHTELVPNILHRPNIAPQTTEFHSNNAMAESSALLPLCDLLVLLRGGERLNWRLLVLTPQVSLLTGLQVLVLFLIAELLITKIIKITGV